jgi:tetratricopeptide (TPR) repeat protein
MSADLIARAEQRLDWAENLLDDDNPQAALRECESAVDFAEQAGDMPDARAALADAHNLRGVILEELDRLFEAERAYRAALEIDPHFTEAHNNLQALQDDLEKHSGVRRDDLGGMPFARLAGSDTGTSLVTLGAYSTPLEAQMARGLLETAGIPAFVADENTVGANWLYSNAVGGVRLQVRAEDVDRARDVLAATPVADDSADDDETDFEDEGQYEDDVTCPVCGSERVHEEKYNRRATFLAWALLGFPVPVVRHRWKCDACGHEWK